MDIRGAVWAALQKNRPEVDEAEERYLHRQPRQELDLQVLDEPKRLYSYIDDYCDQYETAEFTALVNNCDEALVGPFARAAREGTTSAISSAAARVTDMLSKERVMDPIVAQALSSQISAGICDALGLDVPVAPPIDATARMPELTPQTVFGQSANVTANVSVGGGVPPVGSAPYGWSQTPTGGNTQRRTQANGGGWDNVPTTPVAPAAPPKSGIPAWLIGALSGAAAVAVVSIILMLTMTGKAYAVPTLTSLRLSDALERISENEHFEQGEITYQRSDDVDEGMVIGQSPAPSKRAASGTRIDLVVSSGPDDKALVTVPSLVGLTPSQALDKLSEAGLVGKQGDDAASSAVTAGCVAEQSPEAGTELAAGEEVVYHLAKSSGSVTVPSVVGMTATEAIDTLSALGLGGKQGESVYSDTIEAGRVVEQSPTAGSSAREKDVVTFTLSKGPDPNGASRTTAPTNYTSHAGNVLEHADLDLSGSTLYYRLFTSHYSTKIVARDINTGSSWVVYSEPSGRGMFNIQCDGSYIYFGIGNDYDGDELFDSGTIARIGVNGSGYQELATEDKFGKFMKFYVMGGRIYYYAGGAVRSVGVDGSGDRTEVQLSGDAEFFCWNGSLYLAEGNKSTFDRIGSDGSRTKVYSGASWDDFTVGTSSLILLNQTGSGYALRWVDLSSGSETGSASLGDAGADNKGMTASGDDAIVLLQYDGGSQQAMLYQASRSGSTSQLWSHSGYELVQRPHALGSRIYFSVYATSNSTCAPCSVSLGGGDFRLEDSQMPHPDL